MRKVLQDEFKFHKIYFYINSKFLCFYSRWNIFLLLLLLQIFFCSHTILNFNGSISFPSTIDDLIDCAINAWRWQSFQITFSPLVFFITIYISEQVLIDKNTFLRFASSIEGNLINFLRLLLVLYHLCDVLPSKTFNCLREYLQMIFITIQEFYMKISLFFIKWIIWIER